VRRPYSIKVAVAIIRRRTDANGRLLDPVRDTSPKKFFVVVNSARALPTTSGPVVSNHRTWAAANRAKKKSGHYRVLEVRGEIPQKQHVNPLTDVIFDRNARWG